MKQSKSILVVEDNTDMADIYRVYLEPLNYEVEVASSARDARSILTSKRPDVVVLDLMLGDHGGEPFVRELCTPPFGGMKLVLVSGRNDVARIAEQYGLYGWLRKPFNMDELLQVVERATQ